MEIIEGEDTLIECPNEHPVHEECLNQWLHHSTDCPLCSEPYPASMISTFKAAKEVKEAEQRKVQIKQERKEKIKKIADEMVFRKFIDSIDKLAENKDYEAALDKLAIFDGKKLAENRIHKIMFLKGKINYLKGRYDLAINHLFKLVKLEYNYPEAFLYLGKSYQELGLEDKAAWAFDRSNVDK